MSSDLERRFAEVRAAEERSVPPFARVIAKRPAGAPVSWSRVALAAVVVIALSVGTWRLVSRPNAPVVAFTPGDMRMPTDFLLETLNYPRAGEIPQIGTSDLLPSLTGDGFDTRRLP